MFSYFGSELLKVISARVKLIVTRVFEALYYLPNKSTKITTT